MLYSLHYYAGTTKEDMRRIMTWLNIAFSLLIAILIHQETLPLGTNFATALTVAWLFLTVTLILTINPFFARKKLQIPQIPIDFHTSDGVVSLQHQLRLCLEYGDVETADKIAKKLQKADDLAKEQGYTSGSSKRAKAQPLPAYKRRAEELNKLFYSSK